MSGFAIAGTEVRTGGRCYVIAEAGSNHDGRLEQALELVDVAAEAGADAVKFQLFTAGGLYPPNVGDVDTGRGPEDFAEVLRSLEMPAAWLTDLVARAEQRGIHLLCSAFDLETTATVAAAGLPAMKVASPEATDLQLLQATAAIGVPVLISTGMSTLGEVEESLLAAGWPDRPDLAVLQCTTSYPTPEADANVAVVATLAGAFDRPAGLSDHTLDPELAPAATVAVGGAIVEKHITLSRHLAGPDHPFAIEPDELARLVTTVHALDELPLADRRAAVDERFGVERTAAVLGSPHKRVVPSEALMAACDRRSLHATRDLRIGERLDADAVAVLRGERNLRPGLHPRHLADVLGARLCADVAAGDGIGWDDLLDLG
jgi:N-acetylneuraminate synthase